MEIEVSRAANSRWEGEGELRRVGRIDIGEGRGGGWSDATCRRGGNGN